MNEYLSEGKVCEPGLIEEVFVEISGLQQPLAASITALPHCVVLSLLFLPLPPDRIPRRGEPGAGLREY